MKDDVSPLYLCSSYFEDTDPSKLVNVITVFQFHLWNIIGQYFTAKLSKLNEAFFMKCSQICGKGARKQ